jgi:hypothetical protein
MRRNREKMLNDTNPGRAPAVHLRECRARRGSPPSTAQLQNNHVVRLHKINFPIMQHVERMLLVVKLLVNSTATI